MEANPFILLNGTTENLCIQKYISPTFVLVNTTKGCYRELIARDIQNINIIFKVCDNSEALGKTSWYTGECYNSRNLTDKLDLFQIYNKD